MPTYSAIQLDRFLDQGGSKTTNQKLPDVSASPRLEVRTYLRHILSYVAGIQLALSLYATPESTPLPNSPTSSFPPSSPFLINHKRRGPRLGLLKSVSHQNVAAASPLHSRSFSEESIAAKQKVDEKLGVINR